MISPGRTATSPCQASDEAYDVAMAALAKAQQAECQHALNCRAESPIRPGPCRKLDRDRSANVQRL